MSREAELEPAGTSARITRLETALLDSLLDPTVVIDAFGTIQAASRSVERVLGYKPQDLAGQNVRILMTEPHHSAHDGYLERYRRTGETSILGRTREFEVLRKDGSIVVCDLSVARADLPGGQGPLFVGAFRDATERKRAEAALRAEAAMLRSLATVGESAALLAHEIKNPITAVNVALRAVAAQLGEDDKVVLEDLVARMRQLEALMRRTLSFARPIELRRSPCDADDLFEGTIAQLRPLIAKTGAEVRTEIARGGVRFSADAHLIEEVLSNLVTNALEAGPPGRKIRLTAARAGAREVVLTVEDDGPGIPVSERESVFKVFVSTKPGGTGLGLAICRKIVEQHGGTIRIEESRL